MPIKSDNTKGNPYHDEETGEFTSEGAGNGKSEEIEEKVLYNKLPSAGKAKIKVGANLEEARKKVAERKQVYNLPYMTSASDISNFIESFFPEMLINEVSKYYDFDGTRGGAPYEHAFFEFSDGTRGLRSNIFVQILSKYRYPQQYCDVINADEYNNCVNLINNQGSGKFTQYYDYKSRGSDYSNLDKLSKNPDLGCGLVLGYRGVQFYYDNHWQEHLNECLNSYIGYHTTQPSYSSQGCYGTVNYVAMSKSYAHSYDGTRGHIMKHIINVKDAKIMYEPQVYEIKNQLESNANVIQQKLEKHFSKYMDANKAQKLATGVVGSIKYDLGTTCVLMGGDVLIAGIGNGNQIDILNWKMAKILKDW